jgi:hypothetical protein
LNNKIKIQLGKTREGQIKQERVEESGRERKREGQ